MANTTAVDNATLVHVSVKEMTADERRRAKAGHTHNTDVETKGDYMFVTNREKKGLLALASKVGRAGAGAKPADLEALGAELDDLFQKAIAPE